MPHSYRDAGVDIAAGDEAGARPHFKAAYDMLSAHDWVEAERLGRLRSMAGE